MLASKSQNEICLQSYTPAKLNKHKPARPGLAPDLQQTFALCLLGETWVEPRDLLIPLQFTGGAWRTQNNKDMEGILLLKCHYQSPRYKIAL